MTTSLLEAPSTVNESPSQISSLPPPNPAASFYGLLEEGCSYGLTTYGNDLKVVLFGHEEFVKRGVNLFMSFGGATVVEKVSDGIVSVVVKDKEDPKDKKVLCLEKTLSLYLFGQLCQHKGYYQWSKDEEGDDVDLTLTNEEALMTEATNLARVFRATQMAPAYASIEQTRRYGGFSTIYSLGRIGAENPSD